MGMLDEVRLALKPLADEGIVLEIRESVVASAYGDPFDMEKHLFVATVAGRDPAKPMSEVKRLISQAGLTNHVNVGLHTWGSRNRARRMPVAR
jgi:hypothetical protein